MTVIECVSTPSYIAAQLSYFERHAFSDLVTAASKDRQFFPRVGCLQQQLRRLIRLCEHAVTVQETLFVVEEWDRWCESFEQLEDPAFEEEILDVFMALPA